VFRSNTSGTLELVNCSFTNCINTGDNNGSVISLTGTITATLSMQNCYFLNCSVRGKGKGGIIFFIN
jgi:hypothetical protein